MNMFAYFGGTSDDGSLLSKLRYTEWYDLKALRELNLDKKTKSIRCGRTELMTTMTYLPADIGLRDVVNIQTNTWECYLDKMDVERTILLELVPNPLDSNIYVTRNVPGNGFGLARMFVTGVSHCLDKLTEGLGKTLVSEGRPKWNSMPYYEWSDDDDSIDGEIRKDDVPNSDVKLNSMLEKYLHGSEHFKLRWSKERSKKIHDGETTGRTKDVESCSDPQCVYKYYPFEDYVINIYPSDFTESDSDDQPDGTDCQCDVCRGDNRIAALEDEQSSSRDTMDDDGQSSSSDTCSDQEEPTPKRRRFSSQEMDHRAFDVGYDADTDEEDQGEDATSGENLVHFRLPVVYIRPEVYNPKPVISDDSDSDETYVEGLDLESDETFVDEDDLTTNND